MPNNIDDSKNVPTLTGLKNLATTIKNYVDGKIAYIFSFVNNLSILHLHFDSDDLAVHSNGMTYTNENSQSSLSLEFDKDNTAIQLINNGGEEKLTIYPVRDPIDDNEIANKKYIDDQIVPFNEISNKFNENTLTISDDQYNIMVIDQSGMTAEDNGQQHSLSLNFNLETQTLDLRSSGYEDSKVKISSIKDPENDNEVANKKYVDDNASLRYDYQIYINNNSITSPDIISAVDIYDLYANDEERKYNIFFRIEDRTIESGQTSSNEIIVPIKTASYISYGTDKIYEIDVEYNVFENTGNPQEVDGTLVTKLIQIFQLGYQDASNPGTLHLQVNTISTTQITS